jgi:hypothetical protein
MIADDIMTAIAESTLDAAAKQRVSAALPHLTEALGKTVPVNAMMIAASTPSGALVFAAEDGWPSLTGVGEFDAAAVAGEVYAAIESSAVFMGGVIIAGVTMLLGEAGVRAQNARAMEISQSRQTPVLAVLMAKHGSEIDVLIAAVPMERRVLH